MSGVRFVPGRGVVMTDEAAPEELPAVVGSVVPEQQTEAPRAALPRTQEPSAPQAKRLGAKGLLRAVRAELRAMRREIKRLEGLREDAARLQKILDAADTVPVAPVRALRAG